ncbi:unnamed protein product [Linum trigynum]|uniref:Uncharacterized protein n=1 Tax=Linum trigynum TaxID=586398 RepID=A0AAV2CV40_9ROSI
MDQAAPSHASMGSVTLEKPISHQVKGLGRSPNRRGSSRGFVLNRQPKLRLGNGRQKHLGSKKAEAIVDPPDVDAVAHPQQLSIVRKGSALNPSGDQSAMIQEESRRRRLILEEDSDDDMVDAPQKKVAHASLPRKEGSSVDPANLIIPKAAEVDKPAKRKPRRAKAQSLNKAVEEAAPLAESAAVEGLVSSQPAASHGNRKLRKAKYPMADNSQVLGPLRG